MKNYQMYIDGRWENAVAGEVFESIDPYTAEPWCTVPRGREADVDRAVQAAYRALTKGPWSTMFATARGACLRRFGDLIASKGHSIAETEVRDNGKLIQEMGGQIAALPQWYYYFGGLADKIEGRVLPSDRPEILNYTRHEPCGVVAAITPWNSPLMLLAFKAAPALAAGCTLVIKPSEYASASTLELMNLAEEAGFPPGVINVVTGFGAEVGQALVDHELVSKVSFTGSDVTGRRIYQAATSDRFKRVTLELGGKSPQLIFSDCRIDNAVSGVVAGVFAAAGQSCIAGSRVFVEQNIYDEFTEKLCQAAQSIRIGNPMDQRTQLGPIATRPQFEKVLGYLELAKQEGKVAFGGGRPTNPECGNGWFVEPTVVRDASNTMRHVREEIFGPVVSLIPFTDEDEAIHMGNDTQYGLAAGLWTSDFGRMQRVTARIQAGTVWVNTYRQVSYMTPLGGYKNSGIGIENGQQAIYEYLKTKSIWINSAEKVSNPFEAAQRSNNPSPSDTAIGNGDGR